MPPSLSYFQSSKPRLVHEENALSGLVDTEMPKSLAPTASLLDSEPVTLQKIVWMHQVQFECTDTLSLRFSDSESLSAVVSDSIVINQPKKVR